MMNRLLINFYRFLVSLPPYSPDFNPIEKEWAHIKRALPDLVPRHETLQKAVLGYLSGL
jgi:putative transposase